jgi:hypothetical protein
MAAVKEQAGNNMMDDYIVRAHCSYNLEDALEELAAISDMVRPNLEIDEQEFNSRMAHLYWHLNTAWNCRNLSAEELDVADAKLTNDLGEFPRDLIPL